MSQEIKDEINSYHIKALEDFFGLRNLSDEDKVLWLLVINTIGYSTTSFVTYYDLVKEGKFGKLINFAMENKAKINQIVQKLNQRYIDNKPTRPNQKGLVDDIWQYSFYLYAHNRDLQIEDNNNWEVDHWAVIFMNPHTVVIAANSTHNLPNREEAFMNVRSTEGDMHLDMHDLAHRLQTMFQAGEPPTLDTVSIENKRGVFNTPPDLDHIMSAGDPKSSFLLFLGLSQRIFDDFVGQNENEIKPELNADIIDLLR